MQKLLTRPYLISSYQGISAHPIVLSIANLPTLYNVSFLIFLRSSHFGNTSSSNLSNLQWIPLTYFVLSKLLILPLSIAANGYIYSNKRYSWLRPFASERTSGKVVLTLNLSLSSVFFSVSAITLPSILLKSMTFLSSCSIFFFFHLYLLTQIYCLIFIFQPSLTNIIFN